MGLIYDISEDDGRPLKLVTCNRWVEGALMDFCEKCGIGLEFQPGLPKAFKKLVLSMAEDLTSSVSLPQPYTPADKKTANQKESKKVSDSVFIISVSLGKGCYRHIRISGNALLYDLHMAILQAFAFDDDHAHAFFMDNRAWSRYECYYCPQLADDAEEVSDTDYTLAEVLEEKQKFLYLFDFGDEWRFQCKVLRIEEGVCKEPEVIREKGDAPEQYPDYEEFD